METGPQLEYLVGDLSTTSHNNIEVILRDGLPNKSCIYSRFTARKCPTDEIIIPTNPANAQ